MDDAARGVWYPRTPTLTESLLLATKNPRMFLRAEVRRDCAFCASCYLSGNAAIRV